MRHFLTEEEADELEDEEADALGDEPQEENGKC
jgi:hypothetical protein